MTAKKRLQKLLHSEERELQKWKRGQEGLGILITRSAHFVHDFFIPHPGNHHKPFALRHHALISYVLIAVILKTAMTGALFFAYPTPAHMARVVGERIIELANNAREANGASPLRINAVLSATAETKGQDMIARDYFAHDTPEGKRPWEWINKQAYDFVYAGENLAMDFTTADMIHDAFMASPGHRKNILNPNYMDIGVSVISGEMLGRETEVLVVYFGTTRSDLAAKTAQQVVAGNPQPVVTQVVTEIAPPQVAPPLEISEPGNAQGLTLLGEAVVEESSAAPILIKLDESKSNPFLFELVRWTNTVILAFVIFLFLVLILNIFIRAHIQHTHLVLQTLVVIAFLSSLLLTKLHFAEKIVTQLMIA